MGAVAELNSKQWQSKVLEGPGVILLDFYAPWCGPCQAFAPVLEKVAQEVQGRCTIFKINIEKEEKLTELMKVTGVPTLVLVKDGAEVGRQVGPSTKKELLTQLQKFLA